MRINPRVFDERMDLLHEIRIPTCPTELREVAEKIMMLLTKPGFVFPDYHNTKQFDKILMLSFWKEYCGLPKEPPYPDFDRWFISDKVTSPEWIRRARQWLISGHYFTLKPDVQQRALDAGLKFSRAIKQ